MSATRRSSAAVLMLATAAWLSACRLLPSDTDNGGPVITTRPSATAAPMPIGAAAVSRAVAPESSVLRHRIHDLVKDHHRVPYSSGSVDTWDVLSQADADPTHPGTVSTLYCNRSVPCATKGNDCWEREHLWPRSLGNFQDDDCDYPFADVYNLFPTEAGINASRSDLPFGYCTFPDCTAKQCDETTPKNRMRGGANGVWEVWPERRGDVARALFYMDVRYEGGTHGVSGCPEPDLVLTDDRSLIVPTSGSVAYMGLLSDLIRWHLEDPVDDLERMRNDIIARYQGNRNPFIDHPEWVCQLYDLSQCR